MRLRNQTGNLVFIFLAVVLGAVTGVLDQNASEVQGIVLLILIFTGSLGFLRPNLAWVWALIIGGSILAAHLIAPLFGFRASYPIKPNVLASLLALIPAFIGAYTGALLSAAGRKWISS